MPDIFVSPETQKVKDSQKDKKHVIFDQGEKKVNQASKKSKDVLKKTAYAPSINFSSFLSKPKNIRFQTQGGNEEILLFLRRHFITNLPWVVFALIMAVIPAVVLFSQWFFHFLPEEVPVGFFIILPLFWYLLTFGFVLTNFLLWFFNAGIITNERIVDIDFPFFLYKEFTITNISRIEDVTYKLGGLFRIIFNFGDIYIQTAGTHPNIEFLAVPQPQNVVQLIHDLMAEEELEWERRTVE